MEHTEKKWKGRWDYKPGRSPEELEDERRREALNLSFTERFVIMRHLMARQQLFSKATLGSSKSKG